MDMTESIQVIQENQWFSWTKVWISLNQMSHESWTKAHDSSFWVCRWSKDAHSCSRVGEAEESGLQQGMKEGGRWAEAKETKEEAFPHLSLGNRRHLVFNNKLSSHVSCRGFCSCQLWSKFSQTNSQNSISSALSWLAFSLTKGKVQCYPHYNE